MRIMLFDDLGKMCKKLGKGKGKRSRYSFKIIYYVNILIKNGLFL